MRTVTIPTSKIRRALKTARATFGTFDFTYVPDSITEGDDDGTDGPDASFWEGHAFCMCFFPKLAKKYVDNPGYAEDEAELKSNQRGFQEVCSILRCGENDEVVAIKPEF